MKKIESIPMILMFGDTITGLIKKINMHDVSEEEMEVLMKKFRELNDVVVFMPGMRVLIPIMERNQAEVFK